MERPDLFSRPGALRLRESGVKFYYYSASCI